MLVLNTAFVVRLFLVFARISGFFFSAPVFSHRSIPVQLRVFLALLLAFLLTTVLPMHTPEYVAHPLGLILATALEALTGLLLGFAVQFVFWTVQFASEIIGFQVGLTLAQVYDPIAGSRANPLGRFFIMSLTILFLLLNGHHEVIRGLATSFQWIPLAGADFPHSGELLLQWVGVLFSTALRLATPFMFTILILDLALGILVRMVPQADLFSIALPLKLLLGLIITYFFLNTFFPFASQLLERMVQYLAEMIAAL